MAIKFGADRERGKRTLGKVHTQKSDVGVLTRMPLCLQAEKRLAAPTSFFFIVITMIVANQIRIRKITNTYPLAFGIQGWNALPFLLEYSS